MGNPACLIENFQRYFSYCLYFYSVFVFQQVMTRILKMVEYRKHKTFSWCIFLKVFSGAADWEIGLLWILYSEMGNKGTFCSCTLEKAFLLSNTWM